MNGSFWAPGGGNMAGSNVTFTVKLGFVMC
jgi:hypothetical protein